METFHKHFLLLLSSLFENTNIKLYFPHLRCERPPSTLVYFTTGLEQAIQEDLKDAFRRQSVQSVLAVKSPLTLKNGQVLGMGKAISGTGVPREDARPSCQKKSEIRPPTPCDIVYELCPLNIPVQNKRSSAKLLTYLQFICSSHYSWRTNDEMTRRNSVRVYGAQLMIDERLWGSFINLTKRYIHYTYISCKCTQVYCT